MVGMAVPGAVPPGQPGPRLDGLGVCWTGWGFAGTTRAAAGPSASVSRPARATRAGGVGPPGGMRGLGRPGARASGSRSGRRGAGRTAALESKHNVTHKSVTYGRNSGVEAVRRAPQPGVRSRKGGLSHRNRYQPLDWRVSRTRLPIAKSGQTRMNFIFPPPCGCLPGKGITKQLPGSLRERPQRSPGSTPRRLPMAVPDRGGWASRPRSRRHGGSALAGDRQVRDGVVGCQGLGGR